MGDDLAGIIPSKVLFVADVLDILYNAEEYKRRVLNHAKISRQKFDVWRDRRNWQKVLASYNSKP